MCSRPSDILRPQECTIWTRPSQKVTSPSANEWRLQILLWHWRMHKANEMHHLRNGRNHRMQHRESILGVATNWRFGCDLKHVSHFDWFSWAEFPMFRYWNQFLVIEEAWFLLWLYDCLRGLVNLSSSNDNLCESLRWPFFSNVPRARPCCTFAFDRLNLCFEKEKME